MQTFIATAVDGIMVIDDLGRIQVYNCACERLFQYRPEEVIGQNAELLIPDKHTGERRIVGAGREVVGRRKDGTRFPMYLSLGEGNSAGKRIYVGIVHDLTESKSEIALRESALRHLASIVESSADAIFSMSLDGTILSWNGAAERILGYGAGEIVGRKVARLFPPDLVSEDSDILSAIGNGKTIESFDAIRRRKDGSDIDVSVTVSPFRDAGGKVIGASTVLRDITSRKLSEARIRDLQCELVHATRLTAMGQLSCALADEISQPLTAIMNYVNAARRTLELLDRQQTAKTSEALEKATHQIVRAGQIIRRLRDFDEKREPNKANHDINAIAEEAISLGLADTSPIDVTLHRRFSSHLSPAFVDKVQIQQVMINLMRNAVEAMQASPKRELAVMTCASERDFIEVTVADTGPGVPDDVAHHLFEPFFTTKSEGMGIGLTICRSIVEAHDGRLWLTPNQGGGSAFKFRLPTAAGAESYDGV